MIILIWRSTVMLVIDECWGVHAFKAIRYFVSDYMEVHIVVMI